MFLFPSPFGHSQYEGSSQYEGGVSGDLACVLASASVKAAMTSVDLGPWFRPGTRKAVATASVLTASAMSLVMVIVWAAPRGDGHPSSRRRARRGYALARLVPFRLEVEEPTSDITTVGLPSMIDASSFSTSGYAARS